MSESGGADEFGGWRDQIGSIATDWLLGDLPTPVLPELVLLPLENPDLFDRAAFTARLTDVRHHRAVSIGRCNGRELAVMTSKLGAPAVALAAGVAARAGASAIIGVGFCGAVLETLSCGDLVVPDGAVRDEGVSDRYVSVRFPAVPDARLSAELAATAGRSERTVRRGVVWTTDAPLMQDDRAVREWARHGVVAVDMESSALFVVGRLAGARTATILVASDHASKHLPAEPASLQQGFEAAVTAAFDVVG